MAAGLIISLSWNVFNSWLTFFMKRRDVRREEFNSNIRPPINNALTNLAAARASIHHFSDSRVGEPKFSEELFEIQNKMFTPAYETLSVALQRADASKHVLGTNWQKILIDAEDEIYSTFDALANPTNVGQRSLNFERLVYTFDQLERDLNEEIDRTIK